MPDTEHVDHHFIKLSDNELSFILDFDAEYDPNRQTAGKKLADLRRWANTVKDVIDNGLETW